MAIDLGEPPPALLRQRASMTSKVVFGRWQASPATFWERSIGASNQTRQGLYRRRWHSRGSSWPRGVFKPSAKISPQNVLFFLTRRGPVLASQYTDMRLLVKRDSAVASCHHPVSRIDLPVDQIPPLTKPKASTELSGSGATIRYTSQWAVLDFTSNPIPQGSFAVVHSSSSCELLVLCSLPHHSIHAVASPSSLYPPRSFAKHCLGCRLRLL